MTTGAAVTGVPAAPQPRPAAECGCASCGEQRARDTTAADWRALNAAVRAHAHDRSGVTPWGA